MRALAHMRRVHTHVRTRARTHAEHVHTQHACRPHRGRTHARMHAEHAHTHARRAPMPACRPCRARRAHTQSPKSTSPCRAHTHAHTQCTHAEHAGHKEQVELVRRAHTDRIIRRARTQSLRSPQSRAEHAGIAHSARSRARRACMQNPIAEPAGPAEQSPQSRSGGQSRQSTNVELSEHAHRAYTDARSKEEGARRGRAHAQRRQGTQEGGQGGARRGSRAHMQSSQSTQAEGGSP